jgi:outer membrane receptor protein involved in Fe transport
MRKFLTVFICLALPAAALAQSAVTGVVRDQSGGVVSGAVVILRSAGGVEQHAVTGPEGRFELSRGVPAGSTLVVRAGGFAEKSQPAPANGSIEIILQPATLFESVTVTPSRTEQRLGDIPASVHVIDKETIRQSPAVVADDVLRLSPTFSLFRRTSSLSAHPTAQGVSLRGIGPSGVSRSLVLIDGVPFNDPFGGWVYWTRVPLESVERVELIDGASSSVWGNYALGGVINVVSSRPKPRTFEMRTQAGSRDTWKLDFFGSDVWGKAGVSLDGSFFDTGGFPQVIAAERGQVDTKAKVEYRNIGLKIDYSPMDRVSTFVRGGYFREERDNAKVTTIPVGNAGVAEANDTLWKSASGGVRASLPDHSDLQATLFLDWNDFNSNFMAVAAAPAPALTPRAIGRMTLLQHVPTTGVGGIVQWTKALSTRHLLAAGTDFRRVEGESQERVLDPATGTTVTTFRETGGTQISSGTFVQGQFWPVEALSVTLSGRVDHWRNFEAHHNERSAATGLPTATHRGELPDREDTVFSPRLGALYHVTDRVTAWGSLGTGFRAPTLNELYRQFSVGALVTLANDQLGPERLVGGELGLNIAPVENLTVRTTWFDNRMKNPISNVTLVNVPNRAQRQNLGRTRIRGFQTDVEYRFGRDWRASAAYVLNRARITENAADPNLVGKFLQQVPKNRGSLSLSYSNPRYVTVSAHAIFVGHQFDDDLNARVGPGGVIGLPGYGVLELSAMRTVGRNFDLFVTAQNLLDKEYYVQLLPTTSAAPRLINAGVRVRFSGR